MKIRTDGLIIKEQNIGEQDRLVTVLTRSNGIIRAFVKNGRNIKSAKSSSTRLLCYSRLVIYISRDSYIIDEAQVDEMFIGLRTDVVRMSLAQYFCELVFYLAPQEQRAEEYLRLTLNALYLLAQNKKNCQLIKAVVELRMLSFHGHMPDFVCCQNCKAYESTKMYFLPKTGIILCENCKHTSNEYSIELDMSVTTAIRHCIYAEDKRLFQFQLPEDRLSLLARASEEYLLLQSENHYQTLDFYKMIQP